MINNFNQLSKLGLVKFIEDYDQYIQGIVEDPRNKMIVFPFQALDLLNTVIDEKEERYRVPPTDTTNAFNMLVDEYAFKIGDEVESSNYAGDFVGDQIWNTDSIAYCAKPFLRKYHDQVMNIVSNAYDERIIVLEQRVEVLEKENEELRNYAPRMIPAVIIDPNKPICAGGYSL